MTNVTHMSRRDSRVSHGRSHGVSHGHVTESRSRSRKELLLKPPPPTMRAQKTAALSNAAARGSLR